MVLLYTQSLNLIRIGMDLLEMETDLTVEMVG